MTKSIFQIGIRHARYRKTALYLVVLGAAVFFSTSSVFAQSLFDRRDPRLVDPYSNIVAHQKGDLLQIVISENTDVDNRDERSMDKAGSSRCRCLTVLWIGWRSRVRFRRRFVG